MVRYSLYQGGRRLRTRIHAILFYRYDLCIYGGSRGQRGRPFVWVTSRSLAFSLSHFFFFLKARVL